ncbi:MAG: hypothetical protein U1E76_11995 [Planctomycetota bacterium]
MPSLVATLLIASLHTAGDPADGPTPAEIITKAKERQGGADLLKIEDFVATNVTVQLPDEHGNVNETSVDRRFAADGRLWTRIRESVTGGDYQEGFDGKKYWHYDASKGREIDITSNPEYAADRKKIGEEVDQMRLLLKVFLIRSLAEQLASIERLPDASKDGVQAYVLQGEGKLGEHGKEPMPAKITLWFAKQDCGHDGPQRYDLLGARIAREDGSPPDTLCFWFHSRTPQGIVLPGKVQMFRGDEKKPYLTLGFSEKETQRIKFNNGFAAGDFGPQK